MSNYLTIIKKYLEGRISSSEKEDLKDWLAENLENEILFKREVKNWYKEKEGVQTDSVDAYERFVKKLKPKESKKVILLKPWLKTASYAAILVGVLFGVHYYTKIDDSFIRTKPEIVATESLQKDKIKIEEEDGTITYMDFDAQSDIVTADGTVIGTKEKDQLIVAGNINDVEVEYLEISIPKGKLFQLSLSDGTKVWLNAASTLRFPKNFVQTEKNRMVYLEGEAFFDVITNKDQPFIVNTGSIDVEVLGTQFNVSSYVEDDTVKTTLVEGSVAVNDTSDQSNRLKLIPSYQAVYSKGQKFLNKKKVNTALYTSWMYRRMMIQDESFSEIIKRLERTYDVEIVSTNDELNNTRFTGEFDVENVRQILNVFSETINFTYDLKDKKITINP